MTFSEAAVQEPRSGELRVPHGTLRTHERGDPNNPPVLCVHGVSANARSFDYLAAGLARAGRRVVALDLRGRGWSDLTGPGSYGWASHARDVVDAAGALGLERFDLVGHSMGAYVGLEVAR